jgi:glucosamine--fructose-6-phosphate aminotransferase (isomerizing)
MRRALTESYLFQEIHQQPERLSELLEVEAPAIQGLAQAIQDRGITNVVIAARGTSDNAGRYAQYLLGGVNGLPVALTTPSLFTIYERPPRFAPDTLVLGISQSGQSPDIVGVLEEARSQGQLTAALTNDPASPLAQQADHAIALHAGDERSIAATKTYTTELLAVAMLSTALSGSVEARQALTQIPGLVAQTLQANQDVAQIAERYRYAINCVVIGRGYNYATAFEIALKLKELTYTVAEPYSSADFLHGPLALIEHGFPALMIAPSGRMLAEMQRFVEQLNEREAEVIAITDDAGLAGDALRSLRIAPGAPEWLSPVVAVVPGQLFALHLAYTRHYDPDHPRGLRKVTETR